MYTHTNIYIYIILYSVLYYIFYSMGYTIIYYLTFEIISVNFSWLLYHYIVSTYPVGLSSLYYIILWCSVYQIGYKWACLHWNRWDTMARFINEKEWNCYAIFIANLMASPMFFLPSMRQTNADPVKLWNIWNNWIMAIY